MSHSYDEVYYHCVWGTRLREPNLTGEVEAAVHQYIRSRCADLGVFVHALNGMPDHVHLVCSIPPRHAVADVLENIKGSSSHFVNHRPDFGATLYWQRGYGVLTLARRQLARVVAYVDSQKAHHQSGQLWGSLERLERDAQPDA